MTIQNNEYTAEHAENTIIVFFFDFFNLPILVWTRKNTNNQVRIKIEIHNFIIQSNPDDPLLHKAKASIIDTLL